jgi:hypothetical protein
MSRASFYQSISPRYRNPHFDSKFIREYQETSKKKSSSISSRQLLAFKTILLQKFPLMFRTSSNFLFPLWRKTLFHNNYKYRDATLQILSRASYNQSILTRYTIPLFVRNSSDNIEKHRRRTLRTCSRVNILHSTFYCYKNSLLSLEIHQISFLHFRGRFYSIIMMNVDKRIFQ